MRGEYDGKYLPLYEHLVSMPNSVEVLTFEQIEAILGLPLPSSARRHQAWWANQERGQSLAWLNAGYRTAELNIDEGRLTFIRDDHPDAPADKPLEPLTIAEAKERLAFTLGVNVSQIEITIRA